MESLPFTVFNSSMLIKDDPNDCKAKTMLLYLLQLSVNAQTIVSDQLLL